MPKLKIEMFDGHFQLPEGFGDKVRNHYLRTEDRGGVFGYGTLEGDVFYLKPEKLRTYGSTMNRVPSITADLTTGQLTCIGLDERVKSTLRVILTSDNGKVFTCHQELPKELVANPKSVRPWNRAYSEIEIAQIVKTLHIVVRAGYVGRHRMDLTIHPDSLMLIDIKVTPMV